MTDLGATGLPQKTIPAFVKSPRGMEPQNQPDVAVAQDWMHDLDAYVRKAGLAGYDPFDVKQHPLIRKAQPYAPLRKLTSGLCDLMPHLTRRALGVAQTENPKAHALMALGRLRMFEITLAEAYLAEARAHLAWLDTHRTQGYTGDCWGYPFHVFASGVDTPAGTPVLVVCAIAGEALIEAHRITGEDAYAYAAARVAAFVCEHIPRRAGPEGTHCFGYTPEDHRRVHNANLLGAELLYRVAAVTNDEALRELAEPALHYTLQHQRDDGAWHYGVWEEGEPYDRGNLAMIDHHHTGFVLRSLYGIHEVTGNDAAAKAMARGFSYYRNELYGPFGMPVNAWGRYPVDIHACAESVLCPAVLAGGRRASLDMATLALRWAHWYMRRPSDGAPYYRKHRFFTSRIVFPRWGVAWMYRAMAEYLHAMTNGGEVGHVSGKSW